MIVIQESDKFLHDECGICNLGNFPLWNTAHWALKCGIQLKESGIPEFKFYRQRIWNPIT